MTASLPGNYRGLVLRGGVWRSAEAETGIILLQDIVQPAFRIQFHVYDLLKPLRFAASQEKAFVVAFLALKNSIHYFIKGLGRLHLRQGEFAILHTQERDAIARFEKAGAYQSFEVCWSDAIVEHALPYFSSLQAVFSTAGSVKSFYLHPPGQPAGSKALDIVQDILKAPYDEPVTKLYFEYKVREYLLSLLTEAGKAPIIKIRLTLEEYKRVNELAEKLRSHPNQKFPIADLAQAVQMNEMKLKMVFKELFGLGIFEYHLEARMKEALRLLEETNFTTKAIASMVGYQLTTSFITKFREHFGYPPSEVNRHT